MNRLYGVALSFLLLAAVAPAGSPDFTVRSARSTQQAAWRQADEILARIVPPKFSDRQVSIGKFGGIGDGTTDNHAAIAKAIDQVSKTSGKIVFEKGDYFVDGPIHLKSNVHMHLEKGARIFFSSSADSYLPAVQVRFEGTMCYNYSPLIYGDGLQNIAITGEGTIDGNAKKWSTTWRKKQKPDKAVLRQMGNDTTPVEQRVFANGFLDLDGDGKDDGHGDGKQHFLRPGLFEVYNCENVLVEGVTIKNSPFWTVHPVFCKNVILRDLDVFGETLNDDGIDPDSCEDVLIEGCTVDTRDDAISLKAGRDQDAWDRPGCRNIIVRNNRLLSRTNAFCIGSEMSGGVEYVFAENNFISNGRHALNFKCNLDRGGQVQHIFLRNIEIERCRDVMFLFCMDYHSWRGNQFPTKFNDFYVSDIRCGSVAKVPFEIVGVAAEPIRRVYLSDITVGQAGKKSVLQYTQDILFDDVTVGGVSMDKQSGSSKH